MLQTNVAWRFLPDESPSPSTCWRRLQHCQEEGAWLNAWLMLPWVNERTSEILPLMVSTVLGRGWDCRICLAGGHMFCSWLAMAGASIKEVQDLAGHKTITMPARYAYFSTNYKLPVIDRIAATAAKQHPLKRDVSCLNPLESWCREGGSNPHGRKGRRILSPLRLPVPPSRLCTAIIV
jgi:hypothetical protein